MQGHVTHIQALLTGVSKPQTKAWWERYMRHVVPFRGAKMADIRSVVHSWYRSDGGQLGEAEMQELAVELVRQTYAEDKLAGIIMLHEIVLREMRVDYPVLVDKILSLFEGGFVFEWNTCDWMCIKVLSTITTIDRSTVPPIVSWHRSPHPWAQRASLVSFVHVARRADEFQAGLSSALIEASSVVVKNPWRFAQTGTGWLLRELWLAKPREVEAFIGENLRYFSPEGLRYACEKMPGGKLQYFIGLRG